MIYSKSKPTIGGVCFKKYIAQEGDCEVFDIPTYVIRILKLRWYLKWDPIVC